ncbi:SusD/RagB family nutrient-binding outer membrane lipoprotein [Salegentibacter sediminis]|uniref:SusD/RagB family nutrient-binding outer membrane lipoprotein n=1 Tax=Salegentibacter sediminis TaxID=1930251 RepID=UPI0009BE7F0E|nr:SusD/RagB family nutrient-binding outer membrane lipoprotein [Salegentibacter sediminis]
MKKILITFIALSTLWSCQTDEQYEDLNRDPKNPVEVSADFLFTSATVSLMDQMASPNVNLNITRFIAQYLTATTYLDEPNYDLNNRNIPQNHWGILYREVIFDLQNAKENVAADLSESDAELSQAEKDARIAQLEVLEVYAWQILVDSFGDIPYTEALNADEQTLPAYDDAATIYEDLKSRLSNVTTALEAAQGFSSSDKLYNGDMAKWSKFANSLLVRLAARTDDFAKVEEAVGKGVFESNADNATIEYQPSAPNTNPLWEDLVQSGRSDYVVANTIVDVMNELEDPRRMVYFDDNIEPYTGGIYGGSNSFQSYTHIGPQFRDPTHAGILMDYAEVNFHLAYAAMEGAALENDAQWYYEEGITASMKYWLGPNVDVSGYLSQPEVAYDGTMEQLGTQFWIAMFDNPFEGWSVWRKFDAPEFNLPEDTGNPVPLRLTYPVNEQNLNQANYEAASTAIGGDSQQTPLFWDNE